MELKGFQKESLAKLDAFLRAARARTLAGAFDQVAKPDRPDLFRPHRPLTDAAAKAPFVCLRLPTGGGKTNHWPFPAACAIDRPAPVCETLSAS